MWGQARRTNDTTQAANWRRDRRHAASITERRRGPVCVDSCRTSPGRSYSRCLQPVGRATANDPPKTFQGVACCEFCCEFLTTLG